MLIQTPVVLLDGDEETDVEVDNIERLHEDDTAYLDDEILQ